METTIEKLKQEARASWSGKIGEERAVELESYLKGKLEEYSKALNIPQKEILESWEEDRTYSAINYYQESNQPAINSDKVKVFETLKDLTESLGEHKFRCPRCEEVSTNPYSCNSGKDMEPGETCNWKVGGLFGDLGKGVHIYIKDKLQGETVFMPVSWESEYKCL